MFFRHVKPDHCSLSWLVCQLELTGIQVRWLRRFEQFQIEDMQYVPGEKNVDADAMSRHPDFQEKTSDHPGTKEPIFALRSEFIMQLVAIRRLLLLAFLDLPFLSLAHP